ncbi:MAG: metal ABC transporter substrate-binding protein [Treponema sp.]|nr:metal ABC transporter substrate-binding protein [Treponema sp.]
MNRYRAIALTALLGVLGARPCFAGGKKETPPVNSQKKQVAASTSWVAAIARAGGARDIRVLAPADLRHPPEYELKPSDLTAVSQAGLVIYAGWERFAQKLAETATARTLIVSTENTPEALKAEARRVAELLGTLEAFEAWSAAFDPLAEDLRRQVQAAYPDRRAVVHRMQAPFARWLGFTILGEFGPAEPSPSLILDLVKLQPVLVIDNYHGPSGAPIAEAAGAAYGELLNFPGKDGSETLEDLFRYNARALINAASAHAR